MKKNELPYNKDSGFKVPEGYFQDFEARMMARVTIQGDSLNKNPYKVPENYFEQLEDRIFEKFEDDNKEVKVIPLFNRRTLSYIASVAAVLAVLFSSIVFNNNSTVTFDDLDMMAVENYLFETLDLDNPNQAPVENYNFTASANPNIDKEALFEYLNENIEEPALLLNED